ALGCFCPIALSCYTANKYGENPCLGCVPGGMTAMRTHMRLTYGIQFRGGLTHTPLRHSPVIGWFVRGLATRSGFTKTDRPLHSNLLAVFCS
ncbi:hypothetical protein GOODEAATRI_002065, partial [Goodea atripinnis]